eukprot:1714963-Rhodomonas_salina.1
MPCKCCGAGVAALARVKLVKTRNPCRPERQRKKSGFALMWGGSKWLRWWGCRWLIHCQVPKQWHNYASPGFQGPDPLKNPAKPRAQLCYSHAAVILQGVRIPKEADFPVFARKRRE